jgi:hypothetical protein
MKLIKLFFLVLICFLVSACSTLKSIPEFGDVIANIQEYGSFLEQLPNTNEEPKPELSSFTARAATSKKSIPGYDAIGLARYCDVYLSAPRLPALSTLLNTFGDPMPCVEKGIKKFNLELVQIDLIDATCWRNKVCPAGVPKPTDLAAIESRAKYVQSYAGRYPNTIWQASAGLEHDVKDANTVKKMMAAAKKGCPSCQIVNSPFMGARLEPLELHGTKVRAWSVSGDGASLFDADTTESDNNKFNHTKAGSFSTYGWWNELNLRCSGEKVFVAPLKRTNKPTLDQFWQAYLTFQPEQSKPKAPAICKSVRETSDGEIGKPNAESYCNGVKDDGRGNKGLLILRKSGKKGDKLKIYSASGKEVGCFRYYGKFDKPGLHRWYIGGCSNHKPYELYKALSGEWGFATLGGGQCLRFNAIRRTGTYR